MYQGLDIFFLVFHSILMFFNLFGWIWKPIRKANLITLLLTGGSWFILGIFYGVGYCPLTELHWKVLKHLGKSNLPDSYVKYIADRLTGLDFNVKLINTSTAVLYFMALFVSLYVSLVMPKIKREKRMI